MLRIGAFAKRTGITVKALRHYDRLALLRPDFVDGATGYRSYRPEQFRQVERILKYRDLGFTLGEIRRLLREDAAAADLRRMIETRESLLRRELATVQRRLADMAAWRRSLESRDTRLFPIALREEEPRQVVSLRRRLPDAAGVDGLLAEMRDALPARAMVAGQGAVWHKAEVDQGIIDCEALVFVKSTVRTPKDYRTWHSERRLVASILHDESEPNAFPGVYHFARAHVKPLGYQVECPCRETYFDPANGTFMRTEILFPLRKRT